LDGLQAALLRHGHELEHVAVWIAKIDPAPAAPIVELAVIETPRRAAEGDLRCLDAAEDRVELAIADVKGVMVALELFVVVKQQSERLVD
jgi:hypothetical protein